jgi:hypothetical protein
MAADLKEVNVFAAPTAENVFPFQKSPNDLSDFI